MAGALCRAVVNGGDCRENVPEMPVTGKEWWCHRLRHEVPGWSREKVEKLAAGF